MKSKQIILPLLASLFLFLFIAVPAFAKIGVGVSTGKIVVDEILRPGMVYTLPTLNVINTGTEPSAYGAGVSYLEGQSQLEPLEEWFEFQPETFYLEPGEAQSVAINLRIPLKAVPGEYFAYLKGFPNTVAEGGLTSVGIAAAAKLEFEVAPANMLSGIYYRLLFFWRSYQPWTSIVVGAATFIVFASIFKKVFSFELNVKKRKSVDE